MTPLMLEEPPTYTIDTLRGTVTGTHIEILVDYLTINLLVEEFEGTGRVYHFESGCRVPDYDTQGAHWFYSFVIASSNLKSQAHYEGPEAIRKELASWPKRNKTPMSWADFQALEGLVL